MTNFLGRRVIDGYLADPPRFSYAELQAAQAKGWISQEDFDAAVAEQPSPPHA